MLEGGVGMEEVDGGVASTSPRVKSGISVAQGGPPKAGIGDGGGGGRIGGHRWDPPPQSVIAAPGAGGK